MLISDWSSDVCSSDLSHLAVAAASKRISDLDIALGTPWLYRHAGGVELTEAGEAFLHHSLRVVHEMEQMTSALSDYAFGVKGHVRLGANTSAITQFLADDLVVFMRNHPAIRISLKEENSKIGRASCRERVCKNV